MDNDIVVEDRRMRPSITVEFEHSGRLEDGSPFTNYKRVIYDEPTKDIAVAIINRLLDYGLDSDK